MATERGLKDHEIAQLVNAIRDNVAPICASQQLRARIAAAATSKLGEMGLRLDGGDAHKAAVQAQANRTGTATLGDGIMCFPQKQPCARCDGEHIVGACPKTIVAILDNKQWCAWCNDSHVVGGCPRVPGG